MLSSILPKSKQKQVDLRYHSTVSRILLVRFLEEYMIPTSTFEIEYNIWKLLNRARILPTNWIPQTTQNYKPLCVPNPKIPIEFRHKPNSFIFSDNNLWYPILALKVTTRIRQKLTKSATVQDNEMIYLYKAIHGSVAHSEANSVAKKAKLYIPSAINTQINFE